LKPFIYKPPVFHTKNDRRRNIGVCRHSNITGGSLEGRSILEAEANPINLPVLKPADFKGKPQSPQD
jgi:hypothetical protein